MARIHFSTRVLAASLALVPAFAGAQDGSTVESRNGLVVSVSAPASDIGAAILAKGGNAVDAAVATAFALAVTHPSAGNIGGGGFMVIRLPDGTATTIDYRERAPGKATETMYLGADGRINRSLTAAGWLAPGVPGTVRGLEMAHRKFGKLPWADVVRPAADLATNGWPLSPALARSLNGQIRGKFSRFPSSVAAYGKPGGGEWAEGDRIRLTDLGRVLADIATKGPDVFYTGWIADSIDSQMRASGGIITRADLREYRAVERAPVKGTFLGYEIISMAPPSSGGVVMIQTLNLMERLGIANVVPGSVEYYHRRIEAARRAYLDRARYLGDPDFVAVPVAKLISGAYADSLAKTISLSRAASSVELGADIVTVAPESEETTHFSVVDRDGMAVSNTYTLEAGYGSGVVVAGTGMLLNNEMGDFNKKPGETNTSGDIGTPANLIAPGKRMLSSMSPAIVTRNGQLVLVTGSPGGRTIPNTVLDVILGVTFFRKDVRGAVDLPRIHHQWLPDTTSIEAGGATPGVIEALRAMGHRVALGRGTGQGDAHSILYDAATKTAYGAADRRSPDSKASKGGQ
ncbi:MAG: gamma-glutamyltransferase [Gemmatimonadaceae bacterium]|nr:gamma-glutamyltransferase [Gemmatimonadaceae bacterium]